MRWLVTGGAGFIGSHLVDRLLADRHSVVVLDNMSTGCRENVPRLDRDEDLTVIEADIRTLPANALCLGERFDHIVHLAAAVGVKQIMEHPYRSMCVNLDGMRFARERAATDGAQLFVASTSEVYGLTDKFPCVEDQPLAIGDPTKLRWSYAAAKLTDECLALTSGLPVRIGRFFNTVGPRQSAAYGMVIPRFVQQALAGEKLTVYGDGSQTRTFCHVYDTVEAIIRLCAAPGTIGQIYNIGSNDEYSMRQLARRVLAHTPGRMAMDDLAYVLQPYGEKFQDMPRRVPDIKKIKAAVGWQPTREISQIINDVITERRKCS